ncbi:MAG: class I SAM-dependent methyltransferase [Chloracidobacterium sp.]|nr:class I SAM-dependent methyltransferase [Chloracidobacterium sp.]
MFENFPKTRSVLPPEFQAIYADQYKENRDGGSKASGIAQKLESWMHRKVAADVQSGAEKSTLEIGAGTLNQLPYEPNSKPYDVIEPFHSLFESSPLKIRIRNVYDDISEIPADTKYDRIISIAAFEHICNLPEVIARSGLLLTEGGNLRCGIPSEGTIMWKLGYTLSTGMEFKRKYGLEYEVLMKHEHVNTAKEIEEVLNYFFADVQNSVFGVAKAISFYQFYACKAPRFDRCSSYLADIA